MNGEPAPGDRAATAAAAAAEPGDEQRTPRHPAKGCLGRRPGEMSGRACCTPRRVTTWPDAALLAATGAALLMWDASGFDTSLTRVFGSQQGFAWRHHALTAGLVHEGGRMLAWATLLALLVCAWRAPPTTAGLSAGTPTWSSSAPSRGERWWWWAVTVVCLLLVPTMKQASNTSCPWDLAAFGGQATWVSHWRFGVSDGGPGRGFPSGHAVGAFAFLTQYFLWRRHDRRRARLWLWWVLTVGAVFGLGQLARGAHHASHSAWSAWLCAALAALANQLWAWRHAARQRTARR